MTTKPAYVIENLCANCKTPVEWYEATKRWLHRDTLRYECEYRTRPVAAPVVSYIHVAKLK